MDIVKTIRIAPGHYVLAVSGGVDSVAMLDILRQLPHLHLTVAHFDHGIREDSRADRVLVQSLAASYGLPFVYAEGNLGAGTSENSARKARYEFLSKVRHDTASAAIITAHHQDDQMETAVHNILRGTGRKGMTSLKSVDGILRPLIHLPKSHLQAYAEANNLKWREDSTNADLAFRRNYIRRVILPKLKAKSPLKYERLKQLIRRQHDLNQNIDTMLGTVLHVQPGIGTLRRNDVSALPHKVGRELVAEWLRVNGKRELSRPTLERLTIALKTARPRTKFVLDNERSVVFDKKTAKLLKD